MQAFLFVARTCGRPLIRAGDPVRDCGRRAAGLIDLPAIDGREPVFRFEPLGPIPALPQRRLGDRSDASSPDFRRRQVQPAVPRTSGRQTEKDVDRAEKSEMVATLNQVFKDTGTIVVAHYAGLTVADMTALRARMRDAGAGVKVAKNRLAKLALKGTEAEGI